MEATHLTHTVSFSKKKNLGNYESEDATIFVQFDTPLGADPASILETANDRFQAAKAAVYDQLGVVYGMTEAGDVEEQAVQTVKRAFPGAQVEGDIGPQGETLAPVPAAGGASTSAEPPFPAAAADYKSASPDEKKANAAWATDRLATHPGEFWDNTTTKKGSQPDYKHKDTGLGVWV